MNKEERLEKQKKKFIEMTAYEKELHKNGIKYIAGIDEVGRGPLAGPVYAAAVVLPESFDVLGVDDSKKLTAKKRTELDIEIRKRAIAIGIGIVDNETIDKINILNATKLAMRRALEEANHNLHSDNVIERLLIDAVQLDKVEIPQESIIRGDSKCISIAAASIVAKVARDTYMIEMDKTYPGYSFESNKGYGTKAHYCGIREHGITPIHRRTFLKKFLKEQVHEI